MVNQPKTLEGRRVLIVDDDEATLKILTLNLEVDGAKVITRQDYVSGLVALVAERPFDAVIIDYLLGCVINGEEVTGLDAIEYVSQLDAAFAVPLIILLTAAAGETKKIEARLSELRQQFKERGKVFPRTMVRLKPVDVNELVDAIDTVSQLPSV